MIKSHEAAGVRLAFPLLEQIVPGDLPPSRSWDGLAPGAGPVPGQVRNLVAAVRRAETERQSEDLQLARERTEALERRARALVEEAEEVASAKLAEAERQVQEMLTRATEAAGQIQGEASRLGHEEGFQEGYEAGLRAGNAEAEVFLAQAAQDAEAMLRDAQAEAERVQAEAEAFVMAAHNEGQQQRIHLVETAKAQLLELAFAMARQILKAELSVRPPAVLPMVEAALAKLKGEEGPHIRVHPDLVPLLEEHRGRLLSASPGARRATLEADPGLAPGDFVVAGNQGVVDGRLERQMQVMEEALRKGMGSQ